MISTAVGVAPIQDCGLCTWHVPERTDGLPKEQLRPRYAIARVGIYRPFVAGSTVIIAAHQETVEISFHALGLLPLYRSFDLLVAHASSPSGRTDQDPTQWPPARWTLVRYNDALPSWHG